jgi:hypothetical protein
MIDAGSRIRMGFTTRHSLPMDRSMHVAKFLSFACWFAIYLAPAYAMADVIVIANQVNEVVPFRIAKATGSVDSHTVVAQGQTVLETDGSVEILYDVPGRVIRFRLDANAAYYFTLNAEGWLELRKIQLGGDPSTFAGRTLPTPPNQTEDCDQIPVKILVDDDIRTTRKVWEPRLRKRIAAVSTILQRTCRLQLQVVAIDEWESSDELQDVRLLLREFEQRVDPQPARLAIGFSSRVNEATQENHLGGSPGLLEKHIVVKEWSPDISEAERIEVLLHEVGHFLGAVHSPDPSSVMRPLLGDRQARSQSFEIRFDPVNSLILNLVAEELRCHTVQSPADMTSGTRRRLRQIYQAVEEADPENDSARHLRMQLGMSADSPLAEGTRAIVKQLTQYLVEQQRGSAIADPSRPTSTIGRSTPDRLTELCVQHAAGSAKPLSDTVAARAFLVGLGVALVDSNTLVENRVASHFVQAVDTAAQRRERQSAIQGLRMLGRHDLAQHFFVSAALTVIVGPELAEAAGLAKEIMDARSGSHFSYADLAADLAGIRFANRLLGGDIDLDQLARQFKISEVMPDVVGLPENLDWDALQPQLTGQGMNSLSGYRSEIVRRIGQLDLESRP